VLSTWPLGIMPMKVVLFGRMFGIAKKVISLRTTHTKAQLCRK